MSKWINNDEILEYSIEIAKPLYDSLCPKPENFGRFEWYAIDADGQSAYFIEKPDYMRNEFWIMQHDMMFGVDVSLPLGIDWRLCCWSIKNAKRIWGEVER